MNEEDKVICKEIDEANKKASQDGKLKFDTDIWLRSCDAEGTEPISGETTGQYPKWLSGALIRNGPGKTSFGSSSFQHLFDCSALLHRFQIKDGVVTYQSKFLQSKAFQMNEKAQRIVMTEFGTAAVPDPCQTIFQRFSSIFQADEPSDNCLVSVYPMGDELYAISECSRIHRIDPVTLDSMKSVNVYKRVNIVHHTSHPHVTQDGTLYNVGLATTNSKGPSYSVIAFPKSKKGESKEGEDVFAEATIAAKVPSRWSFHPGYMHSFGMTDNYFVIIEQPLCISVPVIWTMRFTKKAPANMLKWFDNENTLIHIISRKTGEVVRSFWCETFFYFHTINQYEEDGHVVVDICVYKDASVIDGLYMDEIKGSENNPEFAKKFRTRPVRFVLPMEGEGDENLVKLSGTQAKAWNSPDGCFWAKPEFLADLTVELPRFNYPKYLGKKYRYFYGINMGLDEENMGSVVKIDLLDKTTKMWHEPSAFTSEPVFVPSPDAQEEDDGVVLISLLYTGEDAKNKVTLVALDGKTLTELARTTFKAPGDVTFSFHGWFTEQT